MQKKYIVGIGTLCVCRADAEMIAYAIGSCIALCLYEPKNKIGALAHILLPTNPSAERTDTRYANRALAVAIEKMCSIGADSRELVAAIIGGAKMFNFGYSKSLNIGEMNTNAVRRELEMRNIPIEYALVGGQKSRTVHFAIPGQGFDTQIVIGHAAVDK